LHDRQIVLVSARQRSKCGIAGRCWGANKLATEGLVDRIVFLVGKEEDLVFPDWAADLTAETVVVKARDGGSATDLGVIDRVQITVLEIFINTAMPAVAAADHGLVELSAG
jgi:hypothetical protein